MPAKAASPKRTKLSSGERRAQIAESARRVFVAQGLAGARTRDIAAEAGINEAMLYRHYPSKEALFEAAVAEPLERAVAALVEASGLPPEEFDSTGEEMLERTEAFVADLLRVMAEVAPMLGVALFGDFDASRDYYTQRIAPTLEKIREVVEANLASWTHRDFDASLAVQFVFGASWFHATSARLTGQEIDVDRVAAEISGMILHGLVIKQS